MSYDKSDPLYFPGIKFCQECNNMLYPKVHFLRFFNSNAVAINYIERAKNFQISARSTFKALKL